MSGRPANVRLSSILFAGDAGPAYGSTLPGHEQRRAASLPERVDFCLGRPFGFYLRSFVAIVAKIP